MSGGPVRGTTAVVLKSRLRGLFQILQIEHAALPQRHVALARALDLQALAAPSVAAISRTANFTLNVRQSAPSVAPLLYLVVRSELVQATASRRAFADRTSSLCGCMRGDG